MSHGVDLQIIGGDVNLYKVTDKKYFKKISCKIKKKINFAFPLEKWQSGRLRQS